MIGDRRVIALIPARSGSKRVQNKNLRRIASKPLIQWTIESALEAKHVTRVVVSSESQEIISISVGAGAEAPFVRPDGLAGDHSSTNEVILHAIEMLELASRDVLCLLQPTSPLRGARQIDQAIELFCSKSARGVVSVTECEFPPEWAGILAKKWKF